MTAIEVLKSHLKALESGEWISPVMIEQYRKAVSEVESKIASCGDRKEVKQ